MSDKHSYIFLLTKQHKHQVDVNFNVRLLLNAKRYAMKYQKDNYDVSPDAERVFDSVSDSVGQHCLLRGSGRELGPKWCL